MTAEKEEAIYIYGETMQSYYIAKQILGGLICLTEQERREMAIVHRVLERVHNSIRRRNKSDVDDETYGYAGDGDLLKHIEDRIR